MPFFAKMKNAVIASPPAAFIVGKSKLISLPGFLGISLYDVVQFFIGQVKTIGMKERASSIAFNLVMALPPAIIFLFTLIPFFPISNQFEKGVYSLIRDVIPGEKNNTVIIGFLKDFINNPRNGLLSLGFVLSLFFSSNAVMGIMRSFDKNYLGFKKRTGIEKRMIAIKLTLILFVLVLSAVMLLIARTTFLHWMGLENKTVLSIIQNFRWVVIVALFFASISLIYRHAPAVQKKWRLINPGSILASLLMILFTACFSWWVNHFGNYNKLYGSIGTVLILMLLIYFNSLVLLIGFELNVSISSLKKIAEERKHTTSTQADG